MGPRRWGLGLIWCLVLCICLSGCAGTGQKPLQKKLPVRSPATGVQHPPANKEIIRAEQRPLAVANTPRARASVNMVEEGRREMASGNFDNAERRFQEAINIDPGNGIAYYYLARAKFELGQYQQAAGVLDKAEGLLGGSPQWLEAVMTLREMIKERSQ